MAGGKFNQTVHLNKSNYWVEWPEGPLSYKIGERVIRVEVWLMQKSTHAIQMTYQTTGFGWNSWKAEKIWWPRAVPTDSTMWKGTGLFQPGPAMGTAVAITKIGSNQDYFWWSEEVEIV